jgi:O-antigen/teichoic acid export membrane protein
MVLSIVMVPLWSAFTEAWVKKDIEWIKGTIRKLQIWWMVMSFGTVIMVVCSDLVYRIWVGSEIKIPFMMSLVMGAYIIINAWNGIYSQFLNGVGRVRLQLLLAVIGSALNIPFAIFLAKNTGVYGVILATTVISVASAIITPIQCKKIIDNKASGIWAK